MGYPDDLKVLSCMTLFNVADPSIEIFEKVLDKFYNGDRDKMTLDIIDYLNSPTWADAFIYKSGVNLAKKPFLVIHSDRKKSGEIHLFQSNASKLAVIKADLILI